MLDVPPSYTKAEKSSASAGNIFWGGEGENQAGEGEQKVHSLIKKGRKQAAAIRESRMAAVALTENRLGHSPHSL